MYHVNDHFGVSMTELLGGIRGPGAESRPPQILLLMHNFE